MRIATAWFLSVVFLGLGCSSKQGGGDTDTNTATTAGCMTDSSTGASSAVALASGDMAKGMICPSGDQDFFAVEVGPGMRLLDVNLSYSSPLSKVMPQACLFAADGITQIPNASASDTDSSDGKVAVATTFAVLAPGAYVLRISDANDRAADTVNNYVLGVTAAADPDTHEANDTPAEAKPADGAPGYFSSLGDVDIYRVTIANAGSLLQMMVSNPVRQVSSAEADKLAIDYEIMDSALKVLSTGSIPAATAPLDLTRPAPATGTLFVSLHPAAGSAPDRRPEAGYTVVLGEIAESDANDQPPRNDTPATATCLAGASSPCAAGFSGTAVTFPSQSGTIGSRGDRDYYTFRATAATAVVEATLRAPVTAMNLALDVLVPHLPSPCTTDADCKVLSGSCTSNDDCELSHQCVAAQAGACTSATCRQCAGAGVCLPLPDSPGQGACGAILYSALDSDGTTTTTPDGLVRTAQPVFAAGPVFLSVHDNQDDQYDPAAVYTLSVQVAPEPDALDASTDANARNNYYNPYPVQATDLRPSQKRAKDISAQLAAGTPVEGWISYQSDEDWFSFTHPCPGINCGLVFEWLQPGPSQVRPVFMMRTESLSLHESWAYGGSLPTTAAITDRFGDGNCTECSFASAQHTASDSTPYRYYLQVRDAGADDWDFSPSGRYQFRLTAMTPGCPLACSEGVSSVASIDAGNAGPCGCYCESIGKCPDPLAF